MRRLIQSLYKSDGVRSATVLTIGNTASTFLGAVAIILASRFTAPAVFGVFSAIFSFMLLVSKLGDAGTNIALQRELSQPDSSVSSEEKTALIYVGVAIKVAIAMVSCTIGVLTAPYVAGWLHVAPSFVSLGWLSGAAIFFFDYASVIAQSAGRFGLAVVANAGQSIIKIAVIVTLILTHSLSASALVVLYGAAPFMASVLIPIFMHTPRFPGTKYIKIHHFEKIYATARWAIIAVLAAALADNIDVLFVQSFLTSTQTGWYAAAARIASFASVAALSLGVVLNVRVAKYKTREHIDAYLKKAMAVAAISFVGMAAASVLAKYLILYTAGPNYLAATYPLILLLLATGFVIAAAPYVALFYTLDSPQFFAYSGLVTAIALIGLDWVWIPTYGIVGAGWAKLISRGATFLFTIWFARKKYREQYGR